MALPRNSFLMTSKKLCDVSLYRTAFGEYARKYIPMSDNECNAILLTLSWSPFMPCSMDMKSSHLPTSFGSTITSGIIFQSSSKSAKFSSFPSTSFFRFVLLKRKQFLMKSSVHLSPSNTRFADVISFISKWTFF